MKKPMIDIAYDLMNKKKKPVTFLKIWEEVSQVSGLDEQQAEDNIAEFYTDISLDERFVHMPENKWDLRSRHKYEEVVVDTNSLLIDEEDDDVFEEEEEEAETKETAEEY